MEGYPFDAVCPACGSELQFRQLCDEPGGCFSFDHYDANCPNGHELPDLA